MDTLFKNPEMASWLEEGLQNIFSGKPVSMAILAQNENGEVLTGYYHADAQQKAIFAHNINADAMLDVVLNNIDMVRDALDELDNNPNAETQE